MVVLGFFDGIHLGHRKLLEKAREMADERKCRAVMMSFDPHPSAVIPGMKQVDLIYSADEREDLITRNGWVDEVAEIAFTPQLRDLSPEAFVEEVIVRQFHPSVIIIGDDFRFGRGNAGSSASLAQLCQAQGIETVLIPQVQMDVSGNNVKVSSTYIRKLIEEGRMEEANALLADPYFMVGCVRHGNGLGHRALVPTVNLVIQNGRVCPAKGVYVTRTWITEDDREVPYWSVTNIGYSPTVRSDPECRSETFLLNYDGDLYDRKLRVEYFHHTRGEKHFESLEALREQLTRDVRNAEEYAQTAEKAGL